MNNIDVLKELKLIYDYLEDMHDNDTENNFSEKEKFRMRGFMSFLYNKYCEIWEKTDKKELETSVKCRHCHQDIKISDIINYAYVCEKCDENFYGCEVE